MTDNDYIDGDYREVTEGEKTEEGLPEAGETGKADHTESEHSVDNGEGNRTDRIPNEEEKSGQKERFCMMCRRPESKTGRLIEMPGGMCICRDCMQKGMDSVQSSMQSGNLQNLLQNMPGNIQMIDLSSLGLGVPQNHRKKKEETEKTSSPKKKMTIKDIPAPHQIKARLDEYVIGQEHAKKVMSVGVYNHYKRILQDPEEEKKDGVEIQKSNMLMIGPTGSGKTYLVQTLAKLLDVPLALTDATSLTEAGYIGDDIESVVSKLLAAADNDVERAEHGIIFIDEIDKIAKKRNTNQRDVSGEAVQQGLLKILEGSDVEVPIGSGSKNAMTPTTVMNTSSILFICGGAFPDLDEIIKTRIAAQSSIGFGANLRDELESDPKLLSKVTTEDLRGFGMIPEFIGRLPVIFTLDSLDKDMYISILKEPRNSIIKQYQKLLKMDEVQLLFDDDAYDEIANIASERKTGARALRSIIENLLLDIMYQVPKDDNIGTVIITGDYVRGTGAPTIKLRGTE